MSRTGRPVGRIMQRFPCVSGDEPADMWLRVRDALFSRVSGDEPDYVDTLCIARKFSPREWG